MLPLDRQQSLSKASKTSRETGESPKGHFYAVETRCLPTELRNVSDKDVEKRL